MRFDSHPGTTVYESPADPTEPKTQWRLRPLGYRQKLEVQRITGKAPMRALTLFSSIYSAPDGADPAEHIAKQDAAVESLSKEDQDLLQDAQTYLNLYNFAVCTQGINGIDGQTRDPGEVADMLDRMSPQDVASSVMADLAAKIADLSHGDIKKKEPSSSQSGTP